MKKMFKAMGLYIFTITACIFMWACGNTTNQSSGNTVPETTTSTTAENGSSTPQTEAMTYTEPETENEFAGYTVYELADFFATALSTEDYEAIWERIAFPEPCVVSSEDVKNSLLRSDFAYLVGHDVAIKDIDEDRSGGTATVKYTDGANSQDIVFGMNGNYQWEILPEHFCQQEKVSVPGECKVILNGTELKEEDAVYNTDRDDGRVTYSLYLPIYTDNVTAQIETINGVYETTLRERENPKDGVKYTILPNLPEEERDTCISEVKDLLNAFVTEAEANKDSGSFNFENIFSEETSQETITRLATEFLHESTLDGSAASYPYHKEYNFKYENLYQNPDENTFWLSSDKILVSLKWEVTFTKSEFGEEKESYSRGFGWLYLKREYDSWRIYDEGGEFFNLVGNEVHRKW